MAKRKTNVQMVKQQMEFSKYGALSQAFLLEAISNYCKVVAEHPASAFDSPLLNGEAWKAVGEEWQNALTEHFKS